MQMLHSQIRYHEFRDTQATWPMDARAAIFVLEAGGSSVQQYFERREADRTPCHVEATGCSSDDPTQLALFILYTRDINTLHLGFVTQQGLLVGSHVQVNLTLDSRSIQIHGTVGRCRSFMEGWFEGVIHFDREAPIYE
ncbi:MAG TPA: hypothetical protein VL282_04385 [Tepidisphaeraceae bacterium]|nr:hypothetical protein [Tepidisphaeraceae bacterium]